MFTSLGVSFYNLYSVIQSLASEKPFHANFFLSSSPAIAQSVTSVTFVYSFSLSLSPSPSFSPAKSKCIRAKQMTKPCGHERKKGNCSLLHCLCLPHPSLADCVKRLFSPKEKITSALGLSLSPSLSISILPSSPYLVFALPLFPSLDYRAPVGSFC